MVVKPEEVEGKEFVVGVRGYVREEVQAFLRAVARELAERDAEIERLRRELAARKGLDRSALIRAVGDAVAGVLEAADAAAEETKARARRGAEEIRERGLGFLEKLAEVQRVLAEIMKEVEQSLDEMVRDLPEAVRGGTSGLAEEGGGPLSG